MVSVESLFFSPSLPAPSSALREGGRGGIERRTYLRPAHRVCTELNLQDRLMNGLVELRSLLQYPQRLLGYPAATEKVHLRYPMRKGSTSDFFLTNTFINKGGSYFLAQVNSCAEGVGLQRFHQILPRPTEGSCME